MKSNKQAAWRMAEDAFVGPNGIGQQDTREGANYRLWVTTWILPRMQELVPELKHLSFVPCCSDMQKIELDGYTNWKVVD